MGILTKNDFISKNKTKKFFSQFIGQLILLFVEKERRKKKPEQHFANSFCDVKTCLFFHSNIWKQQQQHINEFQMSNEL